MPAKDSVTRSLSLPVGFSEHAVYASFDIYICQQLLRSFQLFHIQLWIPVSEHSNAQRTFHAMAGSCDHSQVIPCVVQSHHHKRGTISNISPVRIVK